MSGHSPAHPCFIDTNVWLYAFIQTQDPKKSASAKALIQQSSILISSQVINEICVNLIKKASFDEQRVRQLVTSFYKKYAVIGFDMATLVRASELRQRWQFSFWDSLIVSSALLGGAQALYSEDMSHGLVVEGGLKLINPFVP